MIVTGSRPVSAMRPAKTETHEGAPPRSLATMSRTWTSVITAVTFTLMPSWERRWTESYAGWRLVFVTGIFA